MYCIHVPGHDPITFSFRSFSFLIGWGGVGVGVGVMAQLSKVLKVVCWAGTTMLSGGIVQELCESRGGRPGLSVLTSLLVSVDVKIY